MALTVATNTGALMAQAAASSVNKEMEMSMERLSTGKRINGAADDAAGVAIASRLTSEITGTNMAIRNAMDGQALIDTAEGAHAEIGNILQRMRELAVQSANDTNDSTDRANLQVEIDQLVAEIDRISQASTWAGQQLLDGDGTGANNASFNLQIGSGNQAYDTLNFTIGAMSSSALGLDTSASLTVGTPDVGATNASVSVASDVITVASGYADADISVTQKVGGSTSTAMGMTIADAAGVISISGAALANDDVYALLGATTVTSYTVSDAAGVLTLTAGDVKAADIVYADNGTATSVDIAETDNTLTVDTSSGDTDGDITLAIDSTTTVTVSYDTSVDTDATVAAKTMAAINAQTTTTGVRATINASDSAVVDLERIGIAADQAGAANALTLLVDGVQTNVTFAAGDTIDGMLTKIATAYNTTASGEPIAATKALTNATTGTITLARTDALVDGTLDVVIDGGSAIEVSVSKGDTFTEIATAVKTAVDAVTSTVGAEGTVSGDTVTISRVFAAGDISIDVNGTSVTTTLAGGETAAQVATAINTQIAAQSFTDVTNTDNGDGTVTLAAVDFGVDSQTAATAAVATLDAALQSLSSQRAELGGLSNRLDSTVNNLTSISSNLQAGRGRIEDADFAAETTSLAKSQILQQASTAMLAQANASKQNVLSLLQG